MAVGPLIKSALKEGIEKIPGASIKAEALPNVLKKQGVKPEELKFSGVDFPTTGRVTKEQLLEAESKRTDTFNVSDYTDSYNTYSLRTGQNNPTYRENVYTFSDGTTSESRFTSSHFPDVPNYLMHTRTYDDTINDAPTRVVQEIQSDLHQAGRQRGYTAGSGGQGFEPTPDDLRLIEMREDLVGLTDPDYAEEIGLDVEWATRQYDDLVRRAGLTEEARELSEEELLESLTRPGGLLTKGIPESPYEKSWLAKGIERELATAMEEGKTQIAIPISGDLKDLHRGDGVQKWYETKVLDTAKKIAHSNNMDFEVVTEFTGKFKKMPNAGDKEYQLDRLNNLVVQGDRKAALEKALQHMPGVETTAMQRYMEESEFRQVVGYFVSNPHVSIEDAVELLHKVQVKETATYAVIKPKMTSIPREQLMDLATTKGPAIEAKMKELNITGRQMAQADELAYKATKTSSYSTEAYTDALEQATKKPATIPNFSLYSSPAAGAVAAYTAISAGYTDEEVTTKLTERGYDEGEAEQILNESKKIAQAVGTGYTVEEVQAHLEGKEPKIGSKESAPISELPLPRESTPWGNAYRALTGNDEMSPKELVARLEVLAPNSSFMVTNIAGFFGNEEARRTVEQAATASQNRIIEMAKTRGLDLEVREGEFYANTDQGPARVTPEWWRSFVLQRGEIGGAIAGGAAGFSAGFAATPPILPILGPLAKPAGGLIGSIVGAALGSVVGTEQDYLINAITMQEEVNTNVMARKALTAAEASVVGDVLVIGGIQYVKTSWSAIVKAKGFLDKHMFDRAHTALKEQLFITDDEAAELVAKLSRVADVPGSNKTDKQIAAAMSTRPGGEGVVKASAAIDPKASAAVAKAIDVRAQDLLESTANLTSENVGRVLKGEFEAYITAVKENFTRVKAVPAQSPRANNFTFDYDALTLEPVLERLGKNIDNPDVAYKFARQAQKIRDMSTTRSLSDLVELRSLINDFKFNKRIRSAKDFDMLNNVLANVDTAITEGAHHTLDNADVWLKEFKEANLSYAKMKSLEKNQLAKILNRPGVTENVIAQALAKYAPALDDTFVEVMAQLPKATRRKAEGAVLDVLANKHTAGIEGGQRAVHFPMLAKVLEGITFTSPDARATKKAVLELAEVFRNDIPLAQASGNIQIPKFQSFLTADPVVRLQYEFATSMFNGIKALAPGSKARALQLVRKTAAVLENPVNSKSIRELVEELDGVVNVRDELEALAVEVAKQQASTGATGMPRVIMYGDGKVLTLKGTGAKQAVPRHRIASIDDMKLIAEATGINPADRKALDQALRDRGYMAVQLGEESVRRLQ